MGMNVLIGRYEFEGPLVNWRGVKRRAGIFAILSFSFAKQDFELVELAEAEDLQSVLQDEEKQLVWQQKAMDMLTFCVHYVPRASRGKRREIVGEILREFNGDCLFVEAGSSNLSRLANVGLPVAAGKPSIMTEADESLLASSAITIAPIYSGVSV